jgi:lipoprotein-releasing system permease protein
MLGDSVGVIEVQTNDPDRVEQILRPLQPIVAGRGVIVDWRQMNSALFSALDIERVMMFIIVTIIVVVAAFNIASSLIMLVRTKTKDIAILRTMGASRRTVLRIFMTVGLTIGAIGILIGLIVGALILIFRQGAVDLVHYVTGANAWDPSVRILTDLPARTDPLEVAAILIVTTLLIFVATVFPARRAANTDPVQVLRYE